MNKDNDQNSPEIPRQKEDYDFIAGLTEAILKQPFIIKKLMQKGYDQFEPSGLDYEFPTIPPGLTPEELETLKDEHSKKRLEFWANMSLKDRNRIEEENHRYNEVKEFVGQQVLLALSTIRSCRYGILDVFNTTLAGGSVTPEFLKELMKKMVLL